MSDDRSKSGDITIRVRLTVETEVTVEPGEDWREHVFASLRSYPLNVNNIVEAQVNGRPVQVTDDGTALAVAE